MTSERNIPTEPLTSPPSGELLPTRFFALGIIAETLQSADLTVIFNRHADATDAERSVEPILPGSAVFIEGFSTTPGLNSDLHELVETYSFALCHYGPDSEAYSIIKQGTLAHIEELGLIPARDWGDFHVHKCRELSLLIQKDCFVAFADYNQRGSSVEDASQTNQRNMAFAHDYEGSKDFPFQDFGDTNHNLAKTILSLEKSMLKEHRMHATRESFAVHSYLRNLNMINDIDKHNVIRRNDAGKIQAYMMFGTAHAKSLAANLEKWGASPTSIEVTPLHDYQYIAKDIATYDKTLRQKLALRSFRLLAGSLGADHEALDEISPRFYESLAPLETNPTGGDDTVRILCELLETSRLSYSDPDKAAKRLEDTYLRIIEGNL